jgi:hypothetical protein
MITNEKEYNSLLDALLPFAEQMLNKHGEFLPFAAVVGADGAVALVAGDIGQEQPKSTELVEFLFAALRKQTAEQGCTAAGVCVDVKVLDPRSQQKTDAVHFVFEHRSGEALDVFFPYRKRFLRGYQFEKPFAGTGQKRVF